ncbi:MAG: hypothetical protein IH899_11515, partial [Planctomycetes bacterium]|nr:hypothetical protein [Planctomycetota bacterium]
MRRIALALGVTLFVVWSLRADEEPIGPMGLSAEQRKTLSERFGKEIWPLLTRDRTGKSCVGCHDDDSTSSLK